MPDLKNMVPYGIRSAQVEDPVTLGEAFGLLLGMGIQPDEARKHAMSLVTNEVPFPKCRECGEYLEDGWCNTCGNGDVR